MNKILKFSRSILLLILALTITSMPTPSVSAQNGVIYLDHTVGRVALTDSIACSVPLEFHISALNNSGGNLWVLHGVFEVNSPDGAT